MNALLNHHNVSWPHKIATQLHEIKSELRKTSSSLILQAEKAAVKII